MRTLSTPRLFLRDFSLEDWDALDAVLSDPEVTRYTHFSQWTAERRREWFAWCLANSRLEAPDAYNWAVTLRETGAVIGWLGIGAASQPTVKGERDLGYALAASQWNHGYATEALAAVLAYEFDTLGTPRVSASCEVENPASVRVMQKAGMAYEGTWVDDDDEGNRRLRHHYAIDLRHCRERGAVDTGSQGAL